MSFFAKSSLALVSACAIGACDTVIDGSDATPAIEESTLTFTPDADVADDADDFRVSPGTRRHLLVVDGLEREVIVHYPSSAARGRRVAAVFMLHGTSGDGEKFLRISGWRQKANEEGFIAVFPSALHHCLHEDENRDGDFDDAGELKVTTKWAAGKLGDPATMPLCTPQEVRRLAPERRALVDHPIADDLAYFDAMLDLLARHYPVDVNRIYASGFSNGGQMTSRLALERSDRFAALAAAAGNLYLDPVELPRPLAFVFTIGDRDDGFASAVGVERVEVGPDFLETDIGSVVGDAILSDYLTMGGLTDDYDYEERTVGGKTVADFVFETPIADDGSSSFHFGLIQGLAHAYPNGRNHPLRLADPLWRFFSSHDLR